LLNENEGAGSVYPHAGREAWLRFRKVVIPSARGSIETFGHTILLRGVPLSAFSVDSMFFAECIELFRYVFPSPCRHEAF